MEEKKDRMQILIENYERFNKEAHEADEYEKEWYESEREAFKQQLIKQERIEKLKMQIEANKTKRQMKRKIQNEIDSLEEEREFSDNVEKLDKKVANLKEKLKAVDEKIDTILAKHENEMLDKLNSLGITDKEMKVERNIVDGKIVIKKPENRVTKKVKTLLSRAKKFNKKKTFKDTIKDRLKKMLQKVKSIGKNKEDLEEKIVEETQRQIDEQDSNKEETSETKKEEKNEEANQIENENQSKEKKDRATSEEKKEEANQTKDGEQKENNNENQILKDPSAKSDNKKEQDNKQKDITVKFDIKTGTYVLIDEQGYKYERDINDKLLNKKARNAFAVEILEEYFEKPDVEDIEAAKKVASKADINLYSLYEQYDKKNGTEYARNYLGSVCYAEKESMPTKVMYDLTKRGTNSTENVKLSWKDKRLIKKMAEQHGEMQIADVDEEPKISIWKKLAIGLGLAGGITALGAGAATLANNVEPKAKQEKNVEVVDWKDIQNSKEASNKAVDNSMNKPRNTNPKVQSKEDLEVINWEDIQPKKPTLREELKVNLDAQKENKETLNKDVQPEEQIENNVGVGSKAELDEGTYYYSSEFAKPTGKMENRNDKTVEIEYIAAVGEDGKYKCCAVNGDIEKIKKEFPGAKIMVAIKNSESDLGWMEYDGDVKEAFEKYARKQAQEQELNDAKSMNHTAEER